MFTGKKIFAPAFLLGMLSIVWAAKPAMLNSPAFSFSPDPAPADSDTTVHLHYPFHDRVGDEQNTHGSQSGMYLHDPSNVNKTVEYNSEDNQYDIHEGIGNMFYRNPSYLTFDEFKEKEFKNSQRNYFRKRSDEENVVKKTPLIPQLHINSEVFDRIFGGNTVDIKPNGSAELIFQVRRSTNQNPSLPIRSQKPPAQFDFDQKIQMNVVGKIGDKMKITTSYNTESQFDFENQMKIEYTGYEDEIIKKIEMGNVSLPLTGSLITGSQSLFGIKAALQFGRLTMTNIYSQAKGKKTSVESQGGAQTSYYEVKADQYESNKHYFLAQYFKDNYDRALANLPEIRTPINITRVEVWVTRKQGNVDNIRSVVALLDLGEHDYYNSSAVVNGVPIALDSVSTQHHVLYPDNASNTIYRSLSHDINVRDINNVMSALQNSSFQNARDFEKLDARLLPSTEYTFNSRLGYVSLNQALNPNEVLAVAYEYTVAGITYRVGEFSNSGIAAPKTLFLKLLKGTVFTTKLPTWELMMKNIYSIGAFQVNREEFKLQVMYNNAGTGIPINYLPAGSAEPKVNGIRLIRVLNLDRLNSQNDPQPDGEFDFIEGVTINADKGRIIFPVREPFGSFLRSKFLDQATANKYAYDFLYDSTKTRAQQDLAHNRYSLKGSYRSSSSSEINLNAFNIPPGSVTVTAGGVKLVENADYTVDYNLGKVRIINAAYLSSNTPVKVELESNSMFSFQTKTLFGSRMDYYINHDLSFGGTILHLNERPITQKVNIGDESISNTIWGLDGTYKTKSRFLTQLIDRIPFYSTKEPSQITASGEYARLMPGHSRQIGQDNGTAYIDDFEGTKSTIDIKSANAWMLASVPQGQPTLFPEGQIADSPGKAGNLTSGFNRAHLAWYVIDPFFYDVQAPANIKSNTAELSNHYSRQVIESEIFPNKQNPNGQTSLNLSILNLAYYPQERGPYNFDTLPAAGISKGLNFSTGKLNNPETRWGGIMRKMETTDFEATNVEFIEFWMMDPFKYAASSSGGDLYFNLGSISEDVLKDGIKNFENGLPTTANSVPNVTTQFSDNVSVWGRIPLVPAIVNAFDNNNSSRPFQDVGFDGLDDANERAFYASYIGSNPYALSDPSDDDYHHFRGTDYDNLNLSILDRYKKYNGIEGNSPIANGTDPYPTSASTLPDMEDVNKDGQFNETESYYQYKVSVKPGALRVGQNFITDRVGALVTLANGQKDSIYWYQFKIPINSPTAEKINGIEDFHSIGFIRMFMKNFPDTVVCRFAKLQLDRSDWRSFPSDVPDRAIYTPTDADRTNFDVSSVSIEENGFRQPIKYVLPPNIIRPQDPSSTTVRQLNEQSLVLRACNLEDGHGRAAYKNINFDIRNYKTIRMYIHAEDGDNADNLQYGDVTAFIRLGNDFTENFYEYEIPLTPSRWGSSSDILIWPEANNVELQLAKLYGVKLERNGKMAEPNSDVTLFTPYSKSDGKNKITVVGSPRLNEIRTIMIGIRNPFRYTVTQTDDGLPKCAEIWVDELRVTDFDDEGGWAANGRVSVKLADIGTVNLSAVHKSYNWGTLEQKINEKSKNNENTYDFSGTTELGKFAPEKIKVKVPMYVGYSESWKRPKFDPNNPDIPFDEEKHILDSLGLIEQKKEFIHTSEDYTMRRSLNFTNVKKEKNPGNKSKPHFYDVENWSLNYAFTDLYNRSEIIQYKYQKEYRGGLAYVFSTSPKNIAPFSKVSFLKSSWFKLVKDFNFQYSPSSFAFRTNLDRQYSETLLRNTTGSPFGMDTAFNKLFNMTRIYDFKIDPTKSIKIDFTATNLSRIDEPAGRVNKKDERYDHDIDSIKSNLFGINAPMGGRTTDYHHSGNVNYTLPINKIPLFDWLSSNAKYGYDYHWIAAPLVYDSLEDRMVPDQQIGNSISNSQTMSLSGNANFTTIYNKVPYFKRVAQKKSGQKFPKVLQPLRTKEDTVWAKNDSIFQNSIPGQAIYGLTKVLMGLKSGSITYSETHGTVLPGYLPKTELMGMSHNFMAPDAGFVFGDQHIQQLKEHSANEGWLSKDTLFNLPLTNTTLKNLQAKVNIEPFLGLKIDLNATRNFSLNHSEYYHYAKDTNDHSGETYYYQTFPGQTTGNFSMSFLSYRTAFEKQKASNDYQSDAYDDFVRYRYTISQRVNGLNDSANHTAPPPGGFYQGYSGVSQEVLIPAFLAAYGGTNANSQPIGRGQHDSHIFPTIPLPNWRVTYDGFSKMEWSKKYFNSITLNHTYRSSYSINTFTTSSLFKESEFNNVTTYNDTGDFRSRYEIGQVSIAEQFAPFAGIDISWKNNITSKFEYKRDRNLSLSLANTQLTETHGKDYVFGLGYKWKNFKVPFKINGKITKLKNDLVFKNDLTIRRSITLTRKLNEATVQTTGGMKTYKVSSSVEYMVNERFSLKLFYERTVNIPEISTSFKTTNWNAGFSIRFTLTG